jgi:uncharacterized Zn finger protein
VSSALPLADAQRRLGKPGRPRKASLVEQAAFVVAPNLPRLLGLRAAAAYLGVGERTARELDAAGVLRRVRIPGPGGAAMRKGLYDRADLDTLVAVWKDPAR